MKTFLLVGLFSFLMLSIRSLAVAGKYTLPYPSYMPGHILYWPSRKIDELNDWWYWGNIARIKYYLKLGDKYLVESKTLYEYKQYLLADNALLRSDEAVKKILKYIEEAQAEGKDLSLFKSLVQSALDEHKIVLINLLTILPKDYLWTPEQDEPTYLPLRDQLQTSIRMREHIQSELGKL